MQLLARAEKDRKNLYFYRATIPATFLEQFDRPSQDISTKPIVISYCPIPLRPIAKASKAIKWMLRAVHRRSKGPQCDADKGNLDEEAKCGDIPKCDDEEGRQDGESPKKDDGIDATGLGVARQMEMSPSLIYHE